MGSLYYNYNRDSRVNPKGQEGLFISFAMLSTFHKKPIPILQVRYLRPRELLLLAQGHIISHKANMQIQIIFTPKHNKAHCANSMTSTKDLYNIACPSPQLIILYDSSMSGGDGEKRWISCIQTLRKMKQIGAKSCDGSD